MNTKNCAMTVVRVIVGWFFFYAGISKVLNPAWSAAGYLMKAKTFTALYAWFASPAVLPFTNFTNKWGLTLLGISLILGVGIKLSTRLGSLLMLLYYFPVLNFPYADANGFLVDSHIILICVMYLLRELDADKVYSIRRWCDNLPLCKKYPVLRKLLA